MRSKVQSILALLDSCVISAEEAMRLLDIPSGGVEHDALIDTWTNCLARWFKSKVGQTWEVKSAFAFNVQPSGHALVVDTGYAAWSVHGDPFTMRPGDLLLVVADAGILHAGGFPQTLLHLDSGRTFVASGWHSYAELLCESSAV